MKTKRDFISEITTNEPNFKYCAKTGVINGTLLVDIEKVMQKYAEQQCAIQRVTFCLPIEGDTFVSWHSKHFKLQIDGSVVAIKNETIKYTQYQMLELWNFLTDRLLAN